MPKNKFSHLVCHKSHPFLHEHFLFFTYQSHHTTKTLNISRTSPSSQSTSSAIKNHSGVKTCRVAETRAQQLTQKPQGWVFTKSITRREMSLSSLLLQMSSYHPFRFGAILRFRRPNRDLDETSDQLFELIRFLELLEVQILQKLLIWSFLHCDDGLVPRRVESLQSCRSPLSSILWGSEMSRTVPSVSLILKCSLVIHAVCLPVGNIDCFGVLLLHKKVGSESPHARCSSNHWQP